MAARPGEAGLLMALALRGAVLQPVCRDLLTVLDKPEGISAPWPILAGRERER